MNRTEELMNLYQRWKQTTLSNQLMVITTAIVAFGTLFYTLVAVFQWQLMKASGEQTAVQIKKIITEANNIAESSKFALKQSEVALNTIVNNFHHEQRAWVGPTLVLPPEYKNQEGEMVYVKEGESIKCGLVLKNTGKTPAKNVEYSIVVQSLKNKETPVIKESFGSKDIALLQPEMTISISYPPITGISKENIENIKSCIDKLYIYGIIRYEDVFKEKHWTKFCVYLSPDLSTFSSCETNNDID